MQQISAANDLYSHMREWQAIDHALYSLGTNLPAFDFSTALLKTVAVNQLYSTQLYAVLRMAQHIEDVMSNEDHKLEGTRLVEHIAELPPLQNEGPVRRHISFASKFAHFFVDSERFPIYDEMALTTLAYHLNPRGTVRSEDRNYLRFVENLELLRQRAGLSCTTDQMDRYLWLAGTYRKWQRHPEQVNREARKLFDLPSAEIQARLFDLLPPTE